MSTTIERTETKDRTRDFPPWLGRLAVASLATTAIGFVVAMAWPNAVTELIFPIGLIGMYRVHLAVQRL